MEAQIETIQLNVAIPADLHRRLGHLAVEKRIPRNRIITVLLTEYLSQLSQPETDEADHEEAK